MPARGACPGCLPGVAARGACPGCLLGVAVLRGSLGATNIGTAFPLRNESSEGN
jgi:hypothetical protein